MCVYDRHVDMATMRIGRSVLAALALAAAILLPGANGQAVAQSSPAAATLDEYNKRAREIDKEIVEGRLGIARRQGVAGMFAWARLEYAKVLGLDPENETARAELERIKTTNKKLDDEKLVEAGQKYHREIDTLGRTIAGRHRGLALWCGRNNLEELSREHLLEAHACDPTSAKTAELLGFSTSAILPVPSSPGTIELFRAFREDAGKTDLGKLGTAEDAWGPDTITSKVVVARGKHVGVESTWMGKETNEKTKGWLEELARWGDHSYAMAHALLDAKPPDDDSVIWFAYLDDYTFQAVTAWCHADIPQDRYKHLLKLWWWRGDFSGETVSRYFSETNPVEDCAHLVPQFALTRRFWASDSEKILSILEGFGILCEFIGQGTNATWCVGDPSTGGDGTRKNYREHAAAAAHLLSDMAAHSLLDRRFQSVHVESGAAKSASVMEWLFARDRAAALKFYRDVAGEKPDVPALIKSHFGWTPEEFDEHWRRWAIAIDEADRKKDGGR